MTPEGQLHRMCVGSPTRLQLGRSDFYDACFWCNSDFARGKCSSHLNRNENVMASITICCIAEVVTVLTIKVDSTD